MFLKDKILDSTMSMGPLSLTPVHHRVLSWFLKGHFQKMGIDVSDHLQLKLFPFQKENISGLGYPT